MSISAQPISQVKPGKGCSHRLFIPFGAVFCLVGAGLLWMMLLQPVWRVWQASRWPATDCRIIRSTMEEHDGDDGSTWSPDIEYEYVAGGQRHRSTRVMFFSGSTSGRDWIQRLIAEFPVGETRTCYYNPRKADEAVLKRGLSWFVLLGLLPLLFVGAGLLMLWAGLRNPAGRGKANSPARSAGVAGPSAALTGSTVKQLAAAGREDDDGADDESADDDDEVELDDFAQGELPWADWEGPRKLAPETSLRARVIGLGVVALFWNGIMTLVFWNVWGGGIFTIGMLFLGLFGLVGLGLLAGFVHQLLCLFNPVIEIALENGAVAAGEELVLAWEARGNTARVRELKIEVVVREKATYTRGTSTTTDIQELARLPAFATTDSQAMRFGSVTLRIPPGAIHSFDGARNEIGWSIEIRGRIPFWPDVSERFPFFVKPLGC